MTQEDLKWMYSQDLFEYLQVSDMEEVRDRFMQVGAHER